MRSAEEACECRRLVREMFIAGALTGMVVAYAYGPERCAAAAKTRLREVRRGCERRAGVRRDEDG